MRTVLILLAVGAVATWIAVGCAGPPDTESRQRQPVAKEGAVHFGKTDRVIKKPRRDGLPPSGTVAEGPKAPVSSPEKTEWHMKRRLTGSITEGMTKIETGKFKMGHVSPDVIDAGPEQVIELSTYYIDKYEVTNAQFKEFLEATDYEWKGKLSIWPQGNMPEKIANHPVTYVSWKDARAYATWAGKRLPTEAEWERAARGGGGRKYPWGNKFDAAKCNIKQSKIGETKLVGSYPDAASPYGCCDMAGNVAEWVEDWYDVYPNSNQTNADFGQSYKVLRGGSYFHAIGFATYDRSKAESDSRTAYQGFRCALDADKADK
jgi:formylglycine-generating enzyme required for sulfatase activity